jgi:uncharacterized membrane protein YphA (DoxX/SURF4 family)
MYEFILAIHNILRWVALVLLIVTTVFALIGWLGKREWAERDHKFGVFTTIALDTQLLLGLILYFFLSPKTTTALTDFGAAMKVADVRFFALEHALYMLLAVVLAHLGSALSKKATDSKAKFMRAAIFYGLALLFVLLGMPWGNPLLPGLG